MKHLVVTNTLFGTQPLVIHAHGSHAYKPAWPPIKEAFFGLPPQQWEGSPELTIITCNNGHPAMGLFERSLRHLGVPFRVGGMGVAPWVNAVDKPRCLEQLLVEVDTPYVFYADSRDAILLGDPNALLARFRALGGSLVFGADRLSWPPLPAQTRYEDELAAGYDSEFRYLNGGCWLGETAFCRTFFAHARATPPAPEAPESEQGMLRALLPAYPAQVRLDYHCQLFQNIGFVHKPILELAVETTDPVPAP